MSSGKVLFQLSGSIACFKACQLISLLVKSGYEVEVVATASALRFVGEATLEGLTGRKVHTDLWEPGEAMQHIRLIRWADIAVICPATANTLNKLASGVGDDLLSTLFLAHDFSKPYLVAPAMNATMWRHPSTQASIEKLRSWGVEVLESGFGALACGEVGEGRLLEPEEIFQKIADRLAKPAKRMQLLVTSGGTSVPLDDVRSISNFSTGKTGAAIAEYFSSRGHDVTLLRAENAVATPGPTTRTFRTFEDLQSLLAEELGASPHDAVIHAAAVSDYKLDRIELPDGRTVASEGKIDSASGLTVHLLPNPKLVDQLRSMSMNPSIQVVAFKLTSNSSPAEREAAISSLAQRAKPDVIIENDLAEISESRHPARIVRVSKGTTSEVSTKDELARAIETILMEAQ